MTAPFTSSEGYTIIRSANREVVVRTAHGTKITGGGMIAKALGEYVDNLVALRDAERGWWRWPENPTCIVREGEPNDFGRGRTVYVFVENTFDRFHFNERVREATAGSTIAHQAARAYFEAHPEPLPEPKPWHDAKCGESWYLEPFDIVYDCVGNEGSADGLWFTRANVYGMVENLKLDDSRINGGRRIWPTDAP